jgi:antitoxin component of MazEF toxin-antitoxin module
MTVIRIPDEQAEALKAKAAAQGLTLEAWLAAMACGAPVAKRRPSLTELISQCNPDAPLSADDQVWLDAPATGREA